jgi:hypothetical protein
VTPPQFLTCSYISKSADIIRLMVQAHSTDEDILCFYKKQRHTAVVTKSCDWVLAWASVIQSTSPPLSSKALGPTQPPTQRVTGALFPGDKTVRAWSSSLSSTTAMVNDAWSYASIRPYASIACTLGDLAPFYVTPPLVVQNIASHNEKGLSTLVT